MGKQDKKTLLELLNTSLIFSLVLIQTPVVKANAENATDLKEIPLISQLYYRMYAPLRTLTAAPKVAIVLKNVATCVVNGAVELISFYLPAPIIPLIATAAGMMIPFEPVKQLSDKLPVSSYGRAFKHAMDTFLGMFDKYKLNDNDEFDPYMTHRFNRRMMNFDSKEKKKV